MSWDRWGETTEWESDDELEDAEQSDGSGDGQVQRGTARCHSQACTGWLVCLLVCLFADAAGFSAQDERLGI